MSDPNPSPIPTGSSATPTSIKSRATRGRTDLAWNHVQELGKNKYKCCYCSKIFSGGGIHRMKKHLAKTKGDVGPCKNVPLHVQQEMKADLEGIISGKNKKQRTDIEKSSFPSLDSVDEDVEEIEGVTSHKKEGEDSSKKGKGKGKGVEKYFPQKNQKTVQPSIRCAMAGKDAIERAHISVGRWFYDACIPFNAINSPYFQPMLDDMLAIGPGFKGPTYHDLRGFVLKKNIEEIRKTVDTFKDKWKEFGCTIMADGWTDKRGRTLINFLVYCPKGTVFLKSVDATVHSKTSELLCGLFKEVVEDVGWKNVVQLVTDNAANYKHAGALLTCQYPSICWTPCAAHCIDLMLEDIAKMEDIKMVIDQARSITTFIYNHTFVLSLMRPFTNGKEIIRPAITRFATHFLTLQSLITCKDYLRAMVTSREWLESKWCKDRKGMAMVELLLSTSFWSDCSVVVMAFEPLVRVLRMVDSDERPAMGYMYESMCRARRAIVKAFKKLKKDPKPYINIVDTRWDKQLSRSLHLAGHFLNPVWFYSNANISNPQVYKGLLDSIERLSYGDNGLTCKIAREIDIYRDALGDFGRQQAITSRNFMAPAAWWKTYGWSAPNMQKVAIKILSQTCSSSGCERNWSVFERIHTDRRNRLEHQRLNDLVYVHYNLRLLERAGKRKQYFDPISLEDIDVAEEWVVESETPLLVEEEVESWIEMDQPQSAHPQPDDILGPMIFESTEGGNYISIDDDDGGVGGYNDDYDGGVGSPNEDFGI